MEINKENIFPASFHQERIWFIDNFEKGTLYSSGPIYHNIPIIININGKLNYEALCNSIRNEIQGNKILRTGLLIENNKPFQYIKNEIEFILEQESISEYDFGKLFEEYLEKPFDLEEDLLVRSKVYNLSDTEYILVIVAHHLIIDTYSLKLLAQQIFNNYNKTINDKTDTYGAKKINYCDYTNWQIDSIQEIKEQSLPYWKNQLKGKLPVMELPEDRKRANVHVYKSAGCNFKIPDYICKKIMSFYFDNERDIKSVLLSAFNILLSKYCNNDEMVVGTSFNNRDIQPLKDIIGPISNLVAIRTYLNEGVNFTEYCKHVKKTLNETNKYKILPFEQLVNELNPEKDMSRTALFDILFQFNEEALESPKVEGLKIEIRDLNLGLGKYDINIKIRKEGNSLNAILVYNELYFNENTISLFIGHYISLLDKLLDDPNKKISSIELISDDEKTSILNKLNNYKNINLKEDTLQNLFEKQVTKAPNKIAVSYLDQQLTYKELNAKAEKWAVSISTSGVGKGNIVGVYLEKSIDVIIAILAVLKSGATYLPLDATYSNERTQTILEDSNVDMVITRSKYSHNIVFNKKLITIDNFPENESNQVYTKDWSASDVAYIIYTSGSTGKPKGVKVQQKNVISLLESCKTLFEFNSSDIWTLFHSHTFDFSVWEIFGTLLNGCKLVIVDKMNSVDMSNFYRLLQKERVTVLSQVPPVFYNLIDEDKTQVNNLKSLRYVIFGGDKLHFSKLESWMEKYPCTSLVNMYGITETTVHVTFKKISSKDVKNGICNIGKPIPGLRMYILNRDMHVQPFGIPGEIYVAGNGVSLGYIGREDLTNEKFIINPFNSGERMYKTGDIGRVLFNGEVEYLGRVDSQVQLRGFRIELREIENNLLKHDSIKDTVVVDAEIDDDKFLCAYYVKESQEVDTDLHLREFLLNKLPDYMVPSYYMEVDHIPLTKNGKVDKAQLPNITIESKNKLVNPRNDTERKLTEIWAEILNLNTTEIGVNVSFFEIGGHSLKAAMLINKINETFNITFSLKDIFQVSTIEEIAVIISNMKTSDNLLEDLEYENVII